MDKADRTILWELCNDCRASYESLAKKVNLSPNTVKNRVQNLIDNGIVHHFFIALAADVIDANDFQGTLYTDGLENVTEFVDQLGADPHIGHISVLATVTGGAYLIWGQYAGQNDLFDLGRFLRSTKHVVDLELYSIIKEFTCDVRELTKLHRKVLNCLLENPRLSIVDVADCSGYSTKTVRRALKELQDSKLILFGARPDLAAGGLVNINVKIEWDEKETNVEEIAQWLRERYPVATWAVCITSHHPIVFAEFAVNDLQEAQAMVLDMRESLKIKSTSTLVSYSSGKFPFLSEIKLKEMLKGI